MHHRVSSLTPCILFVWLFVGPNCQTNFDVEGTSIYTRAGVCDERFGWSMFKGERKCLKTFSDRKTWSQAQQVCTAQGGNLLNIPDDTSVVFLTGGRCRKESWWVSLTQKGSSSTWTWKTTPSNLVSDFPSEYWRLTKKGNGDCTAIEGGRQPLWNGTNCNEKKKFICEVKCDAGWILFQPEKTCIKVVSGLNKMINYVGAVGGCQRLGGELITPRSFEMSMLIKVITSLHRRYWIDVVKIGNEFRRFDGSNAHYKLTFTNWDAFEPNMTSGGHVWIWKDKWSVARNKKIPANYICEKKLV